MEGHKPHLLECFPKYISSLNAVIHYTCNAPNQDILDKYGILTKGQDYGCKDKREVLLIPENLFFKAGYMKRDLFNKNVLQMNSEYLMKKLGQSKNLSSKLR